MENSTREKLNKKLQGQKTESVIEQTQTIKEGSKMVNIKTSIGGIVCIIAAVALVIVALVNPTAQSKLEIVLPMAIGLVGAGVALLNAKDNNVTGGTKEQ